MLHLRRGRSPKLATVDRVLAFMAATAPAQQPLPRDGHVAPGAEITR